MFAAVLLLEFISIEKNDKAYSPFSSMKSPFSFKNWNMVT